MLQTETVLRNHSVSHFDIHGLVKVGIVGSDNPIGQVIGDTLRIFKSDSLVPDLTFVLGEYPSADWAPKGYTVGDRLLYDFDNDSSTVFKKPTASHLVKGDVEYVIKGDIRNSGSPVTVYVPRFPRRLSYFRTVTRGVARRSLARTVLAAVGDSSFSLEDVELDAARTRLAILEPFLYYRLPYKGSSLIHGSVVSLNGSGLMFAGSGHIGKTALSLEMVKRGYSYLGDDLTMVNNKGQALPYPEPVRIQEQHLPIFPGLIQKLTSRMGRAESFFFRRLQKRSPGEVLNLMPRMWITDVIDDAKIGGVCALDKVVLIRKGVIDEPVLEEIDPETAAGILSAELFWEFEAGHWRHNQYTYCPSCAKGNDFIEEEGDHHQLITKVISDSIKRSSLYRLRVPYEFPIINATKYIEKILQ